MSQRKQPVNIVTLDAAGQTLGRVASRVATLLRGKHVRTFQPHQPPSVKVVVTNIQALRFTGTKLQTKRYYKFSGYPGGLKVTSLQQEWNKNPEELFRRSVAHMLPKNRLQAGLLQQLTVYRGEPSKPA